MFLQQMQGVYMTIKEYGIVFRLPLSAISLAREINTLYAEICPTLTNPWNATPHQTVYHVKCEEAKVPSLKNYVKGWNQKFLKERGVKITVRNDGSDPLVVTLNRWIDINTEKSQEIMDLNEQIVRDLKIYSEAMLARIERMVKNNELNSDNLRLAEEYGVTGINTAEVKKHNPHITVAYPNTYDQEGRLIDLGKALKEAEEAIKDKFSDRITNLDFRAYLTLVELGVDGYVLEDLMPGDENLETPLDESTLVGAEAACGPCTTGDNLN